MSNFLYILFALMLQKWKEEIFPSPEWFESVHAGTRGLATTKVYRGFRVVNRQFSPP